MCESTAITNLLYRYAEHIDAGEFADAAELFRHARVRIRADEDGYIDGTELQAVLEGSIIRYSDGTPQTKHVITNAIVEFETPDVATARSNYTVLHQAGTEEPRVVIAGRYHDQFERVDGEWRWTERDYSHIDLVGDLSAHLRVSV